MELAQVKPEVTAENVADEDAISSLAGLGLPEPHASARTSWTGDCMSSQANFRSI